MQNISTLENYGLIKYYSIVSSDPYVKKGYLDNDGGVIEYLQDQNEKHKVIYANY